MTAVLIVLNNYALGYKGDLAVADELGPGFDEQGLSRALARLPAARELVLLGRMHDLDLFAGMVGAHAFPSPAGRFVLQLIAEKRGELFQEFRRLLDERPLAEISAEVRTIG